MKSQSKIKILQIANIATPIACFLILGIISFLNDANLETFDSGGEASLIDPAGFAFAIWGPIFFWLALFVVYQSRGLFDGGEPKNPLVISQVSIFFSLSTILSSAWYLFWSFGYVLLSTISMILYLASILAAYVRLGINVVDRPKNEFFSVSISWSLYAGWVMAATIVSITTLFETLNFNSPPMVFSDIGWAVLVLVIALGLYFTVLIRRKDPIYAGVGIWVLLGIIVQRYSESTVVMEVVITAIIGILVLAIGMAYTITENRKGVSN